MPTSDRLSCSASNRKNFFSLDFPSGILKTYYFLDLSSFVLFQESNDGTIESNSVSDQLRTYPSPDPTLTLTCYQLTVVGLGEGYVRSCSDISIVPNNCTFIDGA